MTVLTTKCIAYCYVLLLYFFAVVVFVRVMNKFMNFLTIIIKLFGTKDSNELHYEGRVFLQEIVLELKNVV